MVRRPSDPGPLSLAMALWAVRAGLRDALWRHCTGFARTCNATTMHHRSPPGGVQPARGTRAVSWPRPEGAAGYLEQMQSPGSFTWDLEEAAG